MNRIFFLFLVPFVSLAHGRLARPTELAIVSQRSNSFTVRWDYTRPSSGSVQFLVHYRKYRGEFNRDGAVWTQSVSNSNEYRVQPISIGFSYDVKVKARTVDSAGEFLDESRWSKIIQVNVQTAEPIERPAAVGYGSVPVPSEISAHIISPSSFRLSWKVASQREGDYYVISLEEQSGGGVFGEPKNVRVDGTQFSFGSLTPGAIYRIRMKTRRSGRDSAFSNWLILTLPRENEFIKFSDIQIMPLREAPGRINLTWTVPSTSRRHIRGYLIKHTRDQTLPLYRWNSVSVSGANPTAILNGLEPDTEYFVKILAQLDAGSDTESGTYRFRTPKPNPIRRINVIYSGDSIRLEWTLDDFVRQSTIAGYKVLVSGNPNLPDNQWRVLNVNSRDPSVVLEEFLRPGSPYYVKVFVKKTDGTILKSSMVFNFHTLGSHRGRLDVEKAVTYRSKGRGRVQVRWVYPNTYRREDVNSVRVLYTTDKSLPLSHWDSKQVSGVGSSGVIINGLDPNRDYFLRILPLKNDGTYLEDESSAIIYKIHTAGGRDSSDVQAVVSHRGSSSGEPVKSGSLSSQLCLKACSTQHSLCEADERCIPTSRGALRGWCVPQNLLTSIRFRYSG